MKTIAIPLVLLLALGISSAEIGCGGGEEAIMPSPPPETVTARTGTSAITPAATPALIPTQTAAPAVPTCTYKVVNVYPHDRNAFTQGLAIEGGVLYEGTGLNGQSTLRRVELETGDILQTRTLPSQLFGEGLCIYGNRIIQLTWQSNVGFVYDRDNFELLQEFNYPTEGWGITHNGGRLIMSDGTATLHFLDPETFLESHRVEVFDNNGPVTGLNELEYVQGEIYANVWPTNRIARIVPKTGQVAGWIELKGLLNAGDDNRPLSVLNGIAYDAEHDRLFVTGKLWPRLFEIEMICLE